MGSPRQRQKSLDDQFQDLMGDTDTTTMYSRVGKKTNFQYICFSSQIKKHESMLKSLLEDGEIPLQLKDEIMNDLKDAD